jgi:hypothetical protein
MKRMRMTFYKVIADVRSFTTARTKIEQAT